MKKSGATSTKARSPNLSQRSATIPSINTNNLEARPKQNVHIREMEALRSLSIGSPVPRASSLDDDSSPDARVRDESVPVITMDAYDLSPNSAGKTLDRVDSDRRRKTEALSSSMKGKTLGAPSCLPDQIRPGVVAYSGTVQCDPDV